MKNLIGFIPLLLAIIANAQITQVTKPQEIVGDHYYALPKTAIVMEFTVTKNTYKKGDDFVRHFYEDATITTVSPSVFNMFGIDKEIYEALLKKDTIRRYKLSDVKITPGARRDPNKLFKIYGGRKFLRHNTLALNYGDDGILLSGELASESQAFDAAVKGLSGIASIVGAFFKGDATKSVTNKLAPEVEDFKALLQKYDEYILENSNPNFDVYKDKKTIMTDRINAEFSRLFYETKTIVTTVIIAYIPDAKDSTNTADIPIFKFDKKEGILTANKDIEGKLKILTAYEHVFNSLKDGHTISITPDKESLSSSFTARKADDKGFAYNVSKPSTVVYKNAGVKKDVQYLKIAQYGIVSYINPKQKKTTFELDPLTGDLKKVTGETASITGDNVAAAATSAADIAKLVKGDNEKTKLQNKFDKLDLKKKIKDLEDQGIQ